jgi:hypothetical protein
MKDWVDWHSPYDDPESPLSARLRVVQSRIGEILDRFPVGPLRVISMCAGQGRDVLPVLADHRRAADVDALLVELDAHNAEVARAMANGLPVRVRVVTGDASTTSAYADAVPANLVLACGIFGNITDEDIHNTVAMLPTLCAPGATVIWTRHPREPQLLPAIDAWFVAAGFERVALDIDADAGFGVGVHRLVGDPLPFGPAITMFTFTR